MALDFKITKGSDPVPCPEGTTGTAQPDCVPNAKPVVNLAQVRVKAPKKVKSGKKFSVRASIRNNGDAEATGVQVCIQTPKKQIAGKARRCLTIKTIAPGQSGTVTFRLKSKKAAKKAKKATRVPFTVTAPFADMTKSHRWRGHIAFLR